MTTDFLGKILALTCAGLWSVAVILFKRAGDSIKPLPLNLYKTIIVAVLLIPVMWAAGDSLFPAQADADAWLRITMSGILGIAIADSLFFKCLNLLGAGLTAIVVCMYSPLLIALSWLILGDTITWKQIIGAILVVCAVLVATLKAEVSQLKMSTVLFGVALGFLSMFFMAVSVVLMKPVLEIHSVFWVTEVRLVAALVALFILVAIHRERRPMLRSLWRKQNWRFAFSATIIGNLFAMTIWVTAFKFTTVSSAAILNQTHTIFVVILATLMLGEPFTRRRVMATGLAFFGSALVFAG